MKQEYDPQLENELDDFMKSLPKSESQAQPSAELDARIIDFARRQNKKSNGLMSPWILSIAAAIAVLLTIVPRLDTNQVQENTLSDLDLEIILIEEELADYDRDINDSILATFDM